MQKEKKNQLGASLLLVVLTLVPLIVSAKKYTSGLSAFSWFSHSDSTYDFFLYWKGQALILLCGVICLYITVKLLKDGVEAFGRLEKKCWIPAVAYVVLALLSTAFSEQKVTAIFGGYEQWEGMIILAIYVILMLVAYALLKGKSELTLVAYGVLGGVTVMAFLSTMQAFGYDFFRTPLGQTVMNFMLERKLKFSFNFEVGRVYGTLYNPNYVGSYVALFFPVVASFVVGKKKWAAVVLVFLSVMLLGSQSVTGCIGVFGTLLLFALFMLGQRNRRTWKLAIGSGVCVVAMVVVILCNQEVFQYGMNKIFHPTPNRGVITALESKEGKLQIRTASDDVMNLSVKNGDGAFEYEARDNAGNVVPVLRDATTGKITFQDSRFEKIEVTEDERLVDGGDRPVFHLSTPSVGRTYTIAPQNNQGDNGASQTTYEILNPFNRWDSLRHIPRIGFKDTQHFGSRRGYIWSRTFPLLPKYMLLGSGPNTFVYEFPNDDYVGMANVGYDGAIVTKPHNMYLQIFVQTGFLSLVAFFALYVVYFVQCVSLYWHRKEFSFLAKFGVGIWLGTFGYLVTGLANDSTVCVAPLYWCLLGVGFAVNRWEKNEGRKGN
nr:O-antigen ligase family protein [Eubacterium sp.]